MDKAKLDDIAAKGAKLTPLSLAQGKYLLPNGNREFAYGEDKAPDGTDAYAIMPASINALLVSVEKHQKIAAMLRPIPFNRVDPPFVRCDTAKGEGLIVAWPDDCMEYKTNPWNRRKWGVSGLVIGHDYSPIIDLGAWHKFATSPLAANSQMIRVIDGWLKPKI